MKEIDGDFSGAITFDNIKFKKYFTRRVEASSKDKKSGRIYLPKDLINKVVYILLPEKEVKANR